MTHRRRMLAAALALAASSANAFTPESGFWNLYTSDAKNREGTGLAVEIQNDYMFAAGFAYRADGAPTWVTIEGVLKHRADGAWALEDASGLYTFANGQCIGRLDACPYRQPTSRSIGGFSIAFTAENEGRLEWGAPEHRASVTLRRTCAGSICYDAPSSLLGAWDVVIEHASTGDGLAFGGDKLAIVSVTPHGDRRVIAGCIAASDDARPDCGRANATARIDGEATRCSDACAGYRYRLAVRATDATHRDTIVRVYTFDEYGHGGAFGGMLRGRVDLCPAGVADAAACTTHARIPFVAYKSASIGFVRDGNGTN